MALIKFLNLENKTPKILNYINWINENIFILNLATQYYIVVNITISINIYLQQFPIIDLYLLRLKNLIVILGFHPIFEFKPFDS